MAMSLAFHDMLPSTSGQVQNQSSQSPPAQNGAVEVKLSYAEIATGKHALSHRNNRRHYDLPNRVESTGIVVESAFDGSNCVSQPSPATVISDASSASFSPHISPATPSIHSDSKASQYSRDVWQAAVENMERDNIIREKIGLIINKRYRVVQKISFGSYGSIYSAVDIHTNKDVAVKFEIGSKPASELHLKYENDVYHCMKGELGVPTIYWFGSEYNHHILVMQLLGPSLEQLFSYCERQFNWDTIVSLADQMLLRIWSLHSRGFIHRDIKPENFLMGIGEFENTCFLVDFGLARRFRYRDGNRLNHIPFRKGKSLVGTAKYASINSHNGLELSRRDDLESLGYIVIEFINREVPWREQRGKARFRSKQQSYNRIRNMKEQTDWSVVCPKMAEWIAYCQQLGFSEEPDYVYLRGLIQSLLPDERRRSRRSNIASINQAQLRTWNGTTTEIRQASAVLHPTSRCYPYYSKSPFDIQMKNTYKSFSGNFHFGDRESNKRHSRHFDDGTKRYSWLMRRDSSPSQRYTFECLFRWTLPSGSETVMQPYFGNNGISFEYGGSHDYSSYDFYDRSKFI